MSSCLISQKQEPVSVEFDYRKRGVLTGSPAGCILLSALVSFMVAEKGGRKANYRIGNCYYWLGLKWYLFCYTHIQPENSFFAADKGGQHVNAWIKHILMLFKSPVLWSLFCNNVVCRHSLLHLHWRLLRRISRRNLSDFVGCSSLNI